MSSVAPLNQESNIIQSVTKDVIISYVKSFGLAGELTDQEIDQFVSIAEAYQLNPFKREIHCVAYGEGHYRKLNIIVGYEVYLKRAERTGKLDGWKAWIEGSGDTYRAIVEIFRKDWDHSFIHEVFMKEAVQKKRNGEINAFWKKMPKFQLKKVAISQGFRMCFPDELGGLPYDESELPFEDGQFNINPETESTLKLVNASPSDREEPVIESEQVTGDKVPDTQSNNTENTTLDKKLKELEKLLFDNSDCFNDKHRNWILDQVEKTFTEAKIYHMTKYAAKVIKEANKETSIASETF